MKAPCASISSRWVLLPLFLAAVSLRAADKTLQVQVSAGQFDRLQSVVSFNFPDDAARVDRLQDSDGGSIPLQIDRQRRASFILPTLAKGKTTSFQIVPKNFGVLSADVVRVTKAGLKLSVTSGGKTVLEYQTEPGELPRPDIKPAFQRGGYLHSVLSPSGRVVTDDYPPNHIHHHGIWFPWTKTEFEGREPDFWNMGQEKGRVEFVSLGQTWDGLVHGGFFARHQFIDLTAPKPKAALNESWEVKIYSGGHASRPYRMFDLVSTQECAGASPLRLSKYYYGGLGFRGNWAWNGKDKTHFLTSDGESDRAKANETRGRWCHIGGVVDGQLTGIAILCHSDNFRAPQPMRVHPTEPFFCFAPSQVGDWEITPGKPYVSRYRFIVMDGPPDRAELDRLWNDYANPPEVAIH